MYFRAGYHPDDYATNADWRIRALIEKSTAIKCPTVGYQLAGSKKIQQELSKDGVLERFLEGEDIAKVQKYFGVLKAVDCVGDLRKACGEAEKWFLKPQREGGGFYFILLERLDQFML